METFSDCFWRFIKENVGVSRIYPVSVPTSRQKNKKVLTLEERQERIDAMLQKMGNDDAKLEVGDSFLAEW